MQGLHTHTAMTHANLSLTIVHDHFLNMGGVIGHLELDAYLHGMLTLPDDESDFVAQAVNELLDDGARNGDVPCCRAPYSAMCSDEPHSPIAVRACTASGRGRVLQAPGGTDGPTGTAGRRVPRPSPLLPAHRSVRRER
ncbi:hypothetical protein FDK12_05320 [Arthrobacter sp. NamB2]|uniref:hypothetical protein n=1 Tax=Arthrobacter sp. NamB2 TaxID=2576035 RepID=UPI0010C9DF9D|nr:hypothetical protein [Arthrobacter sp. NamB2]TKV29071.1 hypothetical protein FDK12_05320 [Arthrobacter sp. NamB2]